MYSIGYYESQKRDNFLLLRIIAACMVIYGHSFALSLDTGAQDIFLKYNWGRYSGDLAVSMFFVISGFMVSGSFLRRKDIIDYITARMLRIVPALFALLLVCSFIIGPLVTNLSVDEYYKHSDTYKYVIKNISFSSNMAWTLPEVFENHKMNSMNGSLWTLPAEMRMYVLVAILGILGLLNYRIFCTLLFLSFLIASMINPQLFPLHSGWVKVAGYFCIGIMAQLYKDKIDVKLEILIALIFLTYISRLTDSYFYLLAISVAYFCFWFAYRTPYLNIEKYGDPSYGIYLWGWPIQQLTISMWPEITPSQNCFISLILAIIAGYISWNIIENPALNLKNQISTIRSKILDKKLIGEK